MREYVVVFLVLLALAGLGVAKKHPPGQERQSEAQPTDCSANNGHDCDCRGGGNSCGKSPGEGRNDEQHGHGGDDHGGYRSDNTEKHGKGNKAGGGREDNVRGKGGDKSNKDDTYRKPRDDNREREENHENDSKYVSHKDDDNHEERGKREGHHSNKKDSVEDQGDGHKEYGNHEGHHGSKENSGENHDDGHKGPGDHKGHHGSNENSGENHDDGHKGPGDHKGHHGSNENSGENHDDGHKGPGDHKGHHSSNENSGENHDDGHKGPGDHKGHHGSNENSGENHDDGHKGPGDHKGHHSSNENSGDQGDGHKGPGNHKEHNGSNENSGENHDDGHKGPGDHKGHHSSNENSGDQGDGHKGPGYHKGHNGSKENSGENDDDGHKGPGDHKGHNGSKENSGENHDDGHKGPGDHKGHHGSNENSGENDDDGHKGPGNHKEHNGSNENSGENHDDGHKGPGDHKGHHGSNENSGENHDDGHKGPGDHKGHHSSNENSGDEGDGHKGAGYHKGHNGSKENSGENDDDGHKGPGDHKGHNGSKENSGENDDDGHKGPGNHKEHNGSNENSGENDDDGHKGPGNHKEHNGSNENSGENHDDGHKGPGDHKGHHGSNENSGEDHGKSAGVEGISDELLSILNYTEVNYEQVLFIVDSSQNVGEATFYGMELNFIKAITEVLFSRISYFGVTTYNDIADVAIPLTEYGSSEFIQRVDDVHYSDRDGSDMANVLDSASLDILRTGRCTLIVLISGTESSTDGSGEARLIQSRGNIIIPVVVGEVNHNTATSISSRSEDGSSLYFLFQSWESFSSTTIYINESYGTVDGNTGTTQPTSEQTSSYETTSPSTIGTTGTNPPTSERISACDSLENIDNGHWSSSSCTEESSSEGTVCQLVCASGYDLSGDAEVTCTESGWASSDGDNQLPACLTLEERSSELVERLNHSLQDTSNVLIVLDESSSVGQDEFTNIQLAFLNTLLNFLSLTTRSIGVISYSDTANVVISLGKYQRSVLQERMNSISYEQGGVSNIEMALEVVTSEMQRSEVTGSTLILLVSSNKSSTDGSSQARQISNNGGVIFPLVVGSDYNRLLYISSVTERDERTFFKFTSWESFRLILTFINENYDVTEEPTTPANWNETQSYGTVDGNTGTTQPTSQQTSSYETTSPGTIGTTGTNPPTSEGISACGALENIDNGHWSSSSCTEESSAEGTVCQLVCASGYDLSGDAEVTCTESGWASSDGDNQLPACLTLEERSSELLERLNHSLQDTSNVLIVLDESSSVGQDEFTNIQLAFLNTLLNFLSLNTRSIGVITYSDTANVVISLGKYQRSVLQEHMNSISYERGGASNIEMALEVVTSEIQRSEITGSTLILLVSSNKSSTDGSSQARQISNNGGVIFPLVVGSDYNRLLYISSVTERDERTFFKFTSWESFRSILTFINENYDVTEEPTTPANWNETQSYGTVDGNTGTTQPTSQQTSTCDALENIDNGHWSSSSCTEESSAEGTVCQLVCASGYDLSGDAEVTCTESGWASSDGDNQLPACLTLEERSSELVERLNHSLQDTSNVLIVLDESSSVGQDEFTNIQLAFLNTLLNFLSLTTRSIGVITYSDTANVVISLGKYQRSVLQEHMNSISYEQGGASNIEMALEVVTSEIQRSEVTGSTLILLVSSNKSSTDGSSQARQISNNGGVIFPLVVGSDYNRLLYISSVTERDERTFFKFTSWESFRSILTFINENYDVTEEPTTPANWNETQSVEEVGEEVVGVFNGTITGFQQVLFIVDSSQNVGESTFYHTELNFVKAITEVAFSRISYFGLITYSDYAEVVIPFTETKRAEFIQRVDSVQYSPGDGSDIANVLDRSFSEMQLTGRSTLVVFISGTESSVDGSGEARLIKSRGNFIIPVYVGEVNRDTAISISSTNEEGSSVYFLFQNWEIFNATSTYIRRTYISDSTEEVQVCEALENSQRGHWEASNCSSGTSEQGTVCKLVCEEGYELSGTPDVTCNQSDWVNNGGDRSLPSCKTIEEIGEDFIAKINRTLGRPANLMFVVDGSGSLTEEEFGLETGLVNAIVRAFPLSERRSAGVVTFSSDATVDVSASTDDTCTFLSNVSAIRYPRGGTNAAKALQLAHNELEQNGVHNFTVTFLITDGVSTTDPTESAAVLKRGDNPLFAIGVGDYDAEQLTSIATYFYAIRDFDILDSLKNVLETEYGGRTNVQC
ncbi:uncharacterized protein [Anabrus simplex]|uniref:uncharacterized protein n=1 Tax=Anabrus simplex TaxID=316456 RepID=UPI0035A321CF